MPYDILPWKLYRFILDEVHPQILEELNLDFSIFFSALIGREAGVVLDARSNVTENFQRVLWSPQLDDEVRLSHLNSNDRADQVTSRSGYRAHQTVDQILVQLSINPF